MPNSAAGYKGSGNHCTAECNFCPPALFVKGNTERTSAPLTNAGLRRVCIHRFTMDFFDYSKEKRRKKYAETMRQ
jgi:hypothetical protein